MRKNKKYYSAICTECDEERFITYTEIIESYNEPICPNCGSKLLINNDTVITYKK